MRNAVNMNGVTRNGNAMKMIDGTSTTSGATKKMNVMKEK